MGTIDRTDWARLVARVRSLPPDRVATALGYHPDATDKAPWKRPSSVLSINREHYFDHLAGTRGGGAISLALHAGEGRIPRRRCLPVGAGALFPFPSKGIDGAAPPARRRHLELPARSQALWLEVRDHLVRGRGIGGMLL